MSMESKHGMHGMGVGKLLLMGALHLPIMYFVMFTMIEGLEHFRHNLNMAYMAVMMTAPMLVIEAVLMGQMYRNKRALAAVAVSGMVAFLLFFVFMRQQTAIDDTQFLKSMIPHHSGAILMCGRADVSDPEIKKLCGEIISSQRDEIAEMERILRRLDP